MALQVVVVHQERATLRVGDIFLKVDGDPARIDREVQSMALAPISTPAVLWRKPHVLALAALAGTPIGVLGEPSSASPAAWAAAGATVRMLHDAPLPSWPSSRSAESEAHLDSECEALVASGFLPTELVRRNRHVAEAVFRPWTPVFNPESRDITPLPTTSASQRHMRNVPDSATEARPRRRSRAGTHAVTTNR